jgi:hypothetical protein
MFLVYINVSVSRLSVPDCPKKDVRDSTIMNGQSKESDIDIHKKKTLEMGQSGMDNLMSMSVSLDCPFLIVISLRSFVLCMSMSLSLDCPFLIVLSLTSFSCVCQCQCL